jgi:hypothetical protein
MANENVYIASDFYYQNDNGEANYFFEVGNEPSWGNSNKGALRFTNINIGRNTTVSSAQLSIQTESKGSGSGKLKCKVSGINEDNTADFSSGPMGRSRTTEYSHEDDVAGENNYNNLDVRDCVNAILGRSGWNSGNAMGFFVLDNGTAANVWYASWYARLVIHVSATPNFKPTPISIASPTFPSSYDYGMKVSKPGVSVLTATEADLLMTTRKKQFKVIVEGDADCTAGVEKVISHGLNYAVSVLGFAKGSTYRFKLNRDMLGSVDPVGGGVIGYIVSDSSNIRIVINKTDKVYYYAFIDPVNES